MVGTSLECEECESVAGDTPRGIEEVSRSVDSGACDVAGWTPELGVLVEPKFGRKERHDERVLWSTGHSVAFDDGDVERGMDAWSTGQDVADAVGVVWSTGQDMVSKGMMTEFTAFRPPFHPDSGLSQN